eukprot:2035625-Rhodomonas_salina.6
MSTLPTRTARSAADTACRRRRPRQERVPWRWPPEARCNWSGSDSLQRGQEELPSLMLILHTSSLWRRRALHPRVAFATGAIPVWSIAKVSPRHDCPNASDAVSSTTPARSLATASPPPPHTPQAAKSSIA